MKSKENRRIQSVTKTFTKRPHMDWIDDKYLQLTLDILWDAEGVSMQDWKDCSNAIEGYFGMSIDYKQQCIGKDLVIVDMQSQIEELEKQVLVLKTKYAEAKDEVINNGGDVKQFEEIGQLVRDYMESSAVVEDMDGNTIYKENKNK